MKNKALFILSTVAIVVSQACGTGTKKQTNDSTGTNGVEATSPPSVIDTSIRRDSSARPDTGTKLPSEAPPIK